MSEVPESSIKRFDVSLESLLMLFADIGLSSVTFTKRVSWSASMLGFSTLTL